MSLVFGLALLITGSSGLNCYTCAGEGRGDLTCIDDPKHVPGVNSVDCHQGEDMCCTITRQVYREHQDTIVSFSRGCQENCEVKGDSDFEKAEDSSSVFYITKCDTPFCNTGEGNKPLPAHGNGGNGGGDGLITGIPAINHSHISNSPPGLTTLLMLGFGLVLGILTFIQ